MSQKLFWTVTSFIWAWAYTLGYNQMGGMANVHASVICIGIGFILSFANGGLTVLGPNAIWVSLLLIAPFNIATAFDQADTAIRWLFFFALLKIAGSFTNVKPAEFMRSFTTWLPLGLAVVMLADFYARSGTELYDERAKGAGHAITLYATLLAALAPFGRRFAWTLLIWSACIAFIYLSGSRGALFSLIPTFIIAFVYYVKVRRRMESGTVFAMLLMIAFFGPVIFNIFAEIKVANIARVSGWESAENSLRTRVQLALNAWGLVKQEAWTGWGIGQSYNRVEGLYESVAVHSLWIITMLQLGIPMGIAINLYVIALPFRVIVSGIFDEHFTWMTISVFVVYFFRVTFETITFFDLGSMWSFAHLVLFVYILAQLGGDAPGGRRLRQ